MDSFWVGMVGAAVIGILGGLIGVGIGVPIWVGAVISGVLSGFYADKVGEVTVNFFGGKNGQN